MESSAAGTASYSLQMSVWLVFLLTLCAFAACRRRGRPRRHATAPRQCRWRLGDKVFGRLPRQDVASYRDAQCSTQEPHRWNPTIVSSYSLQMPEWLVFLRMTCAFAEGAAELVANVKQTPAPAAAACVAAVLNDPHSRIAVVGGREGMSWSLGSVYGGSVTRFLGGFRGGFSRTIATAEVTSGSSVAVSRDGSTLLVSDGNCFSHTLNIFSVHTGALLRTIGGLGSGPLQFCDPQVWVASDGYVFVADCGNRRIQILTPQYEFHKFVGMDSLIIITPTGVCANDDFIVVAELLNHRISVLSRNVGALLWRFGSGGGGDGELYHPRSLCFMSGQRRVAVADTGNNRISVWTLEGEFVRNVGVGKLKTPMSVACSDADELVVADWLKRVVVFSASGEIVWTSETSAAGCFTGVTIQGSAIFAQTGEIFTQFGGDSMCVVFT